LYDNFALEIVILRLEYPYFFGYRTLRTFSSRPKGCIKMRELNKVVPNLQVVAMKCRHNEDMISEV